MSQQRPKGVNELLPVTPGRVSIRFAWQELQDTIYKHSAKNAALKLI
jgi:hypothetical protein